MERIGRFEVVKELGRGAMGAVHLARDPLIDRAVAIKTIAMTGLSDAEREAYRQRFFREAQAAGKLSHGGIVTIYDVGEDEATRLPYIVMEFVAGRTLADLLDEAAGPLPREQALRWICQVAQALSFAHARGIIHRDVKPANIMIDGEGNAKLTDFGIARLRHTQLTTAGDLLGTPAYMSPEQVQGNPVDSRSDIFSLGILLYWTLTGSKPFDGENPGEVMFKIAYQDPAPATQLAPSLAPGFDYVIARALAKDPAHRYADAREIALDIEDLLAGRAPRSQATAPPLPAAATAAPPKPTERTVMVPAAEMVLPLPAAGKPQRRATDAKVVLAAAAHAGKAAAQYAVAGAKEGARFVRGLPWQRWGAALKSGWQRFRALPGKVQLGVAGVLLVALLFALWEPLFSPKANLSIRCTHDLSAGVLTILVDEQEVLQGELTGSTQRRMGVFRRTEGIYAATARIPVGLHVIRVRIRSEDERMLASREVQGRFSKDETRVLVVQFESRTGGMRIALD